MENKFEQLTQKLYQEGLEQGRSQGEKIVADAKAQAKTIVAEAKAEAEKIVADAQRKGEEVSRNAMTELSIASKSGLAALRESIRNMITLRTVAEPLSQAMLDVDFIERMLLAMASSWRSDRPDISLSALLPASMQQQFEADEARAVQSLLAAGIEVGYSDKVRSGFKIAPSDGGYYIGFSEEDFEALLSEFLKDKLSNLLYK